jgi:hypothetical protein
MIRNFDLIRKIMLEVQAKPAGIGAISIAYEGEYPQSVVNEHAELLIEAGLLKGKAIRGVAGIAAVAIDGLSWNGHDFIDSAKNETIWNKAKLTILKPATAITFDALLQWLKQQALDSLGLS